MAARILHFGADRCYRLGVLKSAGYCVDECDSLVELREALESERETDVVLVADGPGESPEDGVSLAKSCSPAPVVFFRGAVHDCSEEGFDLVIPPLTPPHEWLGNISSLIERCRACRSSSGSEQRHPQQVEPVLKGK